MAKAKELTSEDKLLTLFRHFQSSKFRKDIQDCVRSKHGKGMEYVPWSNIMSRFIELCPTTEYKFHEYEIEHRDNGITAKIVLPFTGDSKHGYFVTTSITCYGITRSMTAPIYGKAFHTVDLAPKANDVHNAQMRCLCKNAAMFGCGIELWTREEISQLEEEEKPDKPEKTSNNSSPKKDWKVDDDAPKMPTEKKKTPEDNAEEFLGHVAKMFDGTVIPKLTESQIKLAEKALSKLALDKQNLFKNKYPHIETFESVAKAKQAMAQI